MIEKKLSAVDAAVTSVYIRLAIQNNLETAANYRTWAREYAVENDPERAAAYESLAASVESDSESLQRALAYLEGVELR